MEEKSSGPSDKPVLQDKKVCERCTYKQFNTMIRCVVCGRVRCIWNRSKGEWENLY